MSSRLPHRFLEFSRQPLGRLLLGFAVGQGVLFAAILAGAFGGFEAVAYTPDSGGYITIARGLVCAEPSELIAGARTLGYPLLTAVFLSLGGCLHGLQYLVAFQLLANLGFILVTHSLLRGLFPTLSNTRLIVFSAVAGLGGMGLALILMTDHLSALGFAVFLHGLFAADRRGWLLAALGLGAATLLRPTFTFLPLVLLAAPFLLARMGRRLPKAHLAGYLAVSLLATGINVAYQVYSFECVTPSSTSYFNATLTLYKSGLGTGETLREYQGFVKARHAAETGRAPESLGICELEKKGASLLRDALRTHPGPILAHFSRTFVRYLLVPIESFLQMPMLGAGWRDAYTRWVRPVLGLLWLPLWLLAGFGVVTARRPEDRALVGLALLFTVYVLGLSVLAPEQGERMRLPVLPLLLALAVLGGERLSGFRRPRL